MNACMKTRCWWADDRRTSKYSVKNFPDANYPTEVQHRLASAGRLSVPSSHSSCVYTRINLSVHQNQRPRKCAAERATNETQGTINYPGDFCGCPSCRNVESIFMPAYNDTCQGVMNTVMNLSVPLKT